MRIVGGTFRGRRLAALGKGDAGAHLRPTSDRVRESLFSMLEGGRFGDPIDGARVLDLFAGTGALGLEALSRGAKHITFVDDGTKAHSLLKQNIDKCRAKDVTEILRGNACDLGPNKGEPFDVVFLDPPYGKGMGDRALSSAIRNGWIAPNALIVWEENSPQLPPAGFFLKEHRKFGDTHITFAVPA